MIVVLEGCDCVGKTTFAEMLSKKTGYKIEKGSSFEISKLGADAMYRHMKSLLQKDNIIIDRFFYSNLVYGELFGYPMMNMEQINDLNNDLSKKGLVIYLKAKPSTIQERMYNRGDDMVSHSDINDILNGYKMWMGDAFVTPRTMLSLDTTQLNPNIATSMVCEMLNQDMLKTHIKAT
ncbi:deoxynucleoside kinase [Bacillus velezensis]|uniref:deoxynucleoside kinase n=1 Tax=Bacillus velezensis TaxID=492670 RepID=UPI0018C8169B|nr:deoxynucleoside kinase [Bacillus velezensis]QPK89865.1 deoxynucleoside kinase [Bacillus velezensis]